MRGGQGGRWLRGVPLQVWDGAGMADAGGTWEPAGTPGMSKTTVLCFMPPQWGHLLLQNNQVCFDSHQRSVEHPMGRRGRQQARNKGAGQEQGFLGCGVCRGPMRCLLKVTLRAKF